MNTLQLLRRIVENVKAMDLPLGPVTLEQMNAGGFVKAKMTPQLPDSIGLRPGLVGVKQEAREELYDFAEAIFNSTARYRRGVGFEEFFNRTFDIILEGLFGRDPDSLTIADVATVETRIEEWFVAETRAATWYVPCAITRVRNGPFNVGPISFTHLDNFGPAERERYPETFDLSLGRLIQKMRQERALWMASVWVPDCGRRRGEELANLAVDIAIAGIKLVIPYDLGLRMTRMTARTLPRDITAVCAVGAGLNVSDKFDEPGQAIGEGTLDHFLQSGSILVSSVGRRTETYVTGTGPLPQLNQAWCDAAYWFNEGLAEPLETIAVPKLETAIEVLLHSQSSRGSEHRMLNAIRTFYGLGPDDLINPTSPVTVRHFAKDFVIRRSRILHGTWSTLASSLRDTRPSLAAFARGLLINYTTELDDFATAADAVDTIEGFMAWVQARRRVTPS
jgi:hypothetical protein